MKKDRTYEIMMAKTCFFLLIVAVIMSLFTSCKTKVPEPVVYSPTTASWVGYYTDISSENCTPDSIHIYYDQQGVLKIKGLDMWTCNQPLPMTYKDGVFTMATHWIDAHTSVATPVEASGFMNNDTIFLSVTNHIKDNSPVLPLIVGHKYYRR